MPVKAAKHENVQHISMVLSGGLNYAQAAANIDDNELKRAMNFIYDPMTDTLITRPGTTCQTTTALGSPILRGYYYEKSPIVGYHVCASGGFLYKVTGAALDTYTSIGALTDATTVPSFLTFNNKLLIADGGTRIRTWDGTTYGTIATSPPATALSMIKNRVVANASDELDSVYFSAPNDAEGASAWDTAVTAIGLKAGYGDSLTVNAFAVLGDDLIVSKVGDKEKRTYRVNVASATASEWYVQDLSQNNAAQSAQTIISAWNNVFFVDTNGFKSIKGTDTYGDLQVDPVGRKISTIFQQNYDSDSISYIPAYNAIWFNIGGRVFCYTERPDQETGQMISAFTDLLFTWDRCTSVYQAGDDVFLTGWDGLLHKLDDSISTDETTPGVTANYTSAVRTKTFSFFVDGILRKLQWYLNPKSAGTGLIYGCTEDETKTLLKTVTITAEGEYLYDSTGDLEAADDELYDTGSSSWIETSRNRIRDQKMAFELVLTSGRCGIQWCKAEIAILEGGE